MLSTQSDERLVDLVRAGSDPAFEAIVERYRRALMRYVSRLLPPERAEDVVQQAFVKAYEAMHRNSAELNLKPWLYRIAHNGALNALRDRGAAHAELSDTLDGVERPDQAFERTVGLRELVVAVQALPERQRSAILLRELEGRSYEEIATALGVSDGAVRQLLNRARNSLRAAAASVIPMPLVERVASSDSTDPVTARVAELVGLGGGALAMKVCATALVTGAAVVGGAAVVSDIGREQASRAVGAGTARAAEASSGESDAASEDTSEAGEHGAGRRGEAGDGSGRADGGGRRDRSDDGPRADRGDRGTGEDGGHGRSEPGDDDRTGRRGGDEEDDNSGPGGVGGDDGPDLEAPDDHSGPGGGGSGSGDPIDEPAEAEAPSLDGSGGSSGPGGGDSGSGTSGSSGSGSGELAEPLGERSF
ncbi:MAG TPA: sigma-70 family RNA polymerase sigma factor [Thermoleophilaceae bacterium]